MYIGFVFRVRDPTSEIFWFRLHYEFGSCIKVSGFRHAELWNWEVSEKNGTVSVYGPKPDNLNVEQLNLKLNYNVLNWATHLACNWRKHIDMLALSRRTTCAQSGVCMACVYIYARETGPTRCECGESHTTKGYMYLVNVVIQLLGFARHTVT